MAINALIFEKDDKPVLYPYQKTPATQKLNLVFTHFGLGFDHY